MLSPRRDWWVLLAVGIAGCAVLRAKPDPTRFYVLAPVADAAADATHLSLGVGPVVLPPYLQRPELATRVGPNEVRFSEFTRWAGALPTQVTSVLGEDLRVLLGPERVVLFPWYTGTALDVVAEVEIFRFEPDADGQVHLAAHWRVKDGTRATLLRTGDTDVDEPTGPGGVDATVAALSRALGRLGREIADAVRATRTPVHR